MGTSNRERRRARQRTRQQRRREQQQRPDDQRQQRPDAGGRTAATTTPTPGPAGSRTAEAPGPGAGARSGPGPLGPPGRPDLGGPVRGGPAPQPDLASLIEAAVHLAQCPDHDAHELPQALAELAARLDGWDRKVLGRLQEAVTACWRRGWQPADLVRVAHRAGGAPLAGMVTDAITAEMRQYASPTVDERWAAQLAHLAATAWWDHDDRFLAAWSKRHQVTAGEVVAYVVEALAQLAHLPSQPRLCPLPGTARPSAAARRDNPVDERMLDRVRALLAKAESTTFPEEAEAYSAKAQELMARHSIDQALLAAGAPARDEPAGVRLGVDNPYEQPKALLLQNVAAANRCRAVWSKEFGFSTVLGFPADLGAVELLYTSLLVQATAAMLHEGSRRDGHGRSRTRSFRQSFLTAYATRIGERLRTATEQSTQQAAAETGRSDLLPVLAAREHEVDEAVDRMFGGELRRGGGARAMDREGWARGAAAADLASLGVRGQVHGEDG